MFSSFLRRKSPISSAPRTGTNFANIVNKVNPGPMAPKSKTSSVLSVLESSNDPTGIRRNSFASAGTNASNPASRSGSFASVGTNASHPGRHNSFSSATQANLVTQRANAPTNIWTQQRPNVLENAKANIAAKLAQEKQEKAEEKARRNAWARQNRVATMKRRGRAANYGTLIGLPHRNNVSASPPVGNVAMSYPVPTFRKRSTRRNRRH